MSEPVLRAALRGDADALVTLRVLMFTAMGTPGALVGGEEWRLAARDWFLDRHDAPGVRVVVAEVGGQVVSCAVGEVTPVIPRPGAPNGAVGLVSNVATLPEHRGLGLAAACTDAVLDWFAARTDVTRVDLFATPAGARIYERRGFQVSGFPAMRRRLPRA